jgi:hypothetical protein
VIAAGQLGPIASGWVDGIGGLEKNLPPMRDMIDRRVRAFLKGLTRSQTGVQDGSSLTDMLLGRAGIGLCCRAG